MAGGMIGGLDNKRTSQWWQWLRSHPAYVVLGLTLLFVAVVRLHLLRMPLERDEGEYAYAGQLILHGVPPYQAAYNMKLPGTYAAYALIMAVFGQSPAGIHFGLLLVNAASIMLMFLLGRRLLDEAAGAAAAVSFALLSLSPSVLGLAGHATHFVVLPALAGTLLLVSSLKYKVPGQSKTAECANHAEAEPAPLLKLAAERRTSGYLLSTLNYPLFAAGLLFGVAFLMKQHGLFFGVFAGSYLVWSRIMQIKAEEERLKAEYCLRSRGTSLKSARRAPLKTNSAAGAASVQVPASGPAPGAGSAAGPRLSHFAAAKLKAETEKPRVPPPKLQTATSEEEQAPGAVHSAAEASCPTPHALPQTAQHTQSTPEPGHAPRSTVHAPTYGSLFSELALLTGGFALPYLSTCLVLWAAGVFPQFWFWTVDYAREYASSNSLVNGPDLLQVALRSVVGPNLIFWLLPWAGTLVLWWEERWGSPKVEGRSQRGKDRPRYASFTRLQSPLSPRFFLLALLFWSFAAASVGLYFREHYFILVLPALSLLTGVAVSRAVYLVRHDRSVEVFLAVPVLLLGVVGLGAALVGNGNVWFASSAAVAHQRVYHTTLFVEAAKMAETIQANASKNGPVAVLGSEPEIYFLSRHRSATGYIYMYPLMEAQPYAKRMQEEMIREIEQKQPEYVVFVSHRLSWLRQPGSPDRLMDWWKDYASKHFDLTSSVSIEDAVEERANLELGLSPTGNWSPLAGGGSNSMRESAGSDAPSPGRHLLLFKRRSE